MRSLDELVAAATARTGPRLRLAIAPCAERFVLGAALHAAQSGLVEPLFIGDRARAAEIAHTLGCAGFADFEFIDCADDAQAAGLAVECFRAGRAQLIMKGLVPTATLLKAVLTREAGLMPPGGILSLVTAFDAPRPPRLDGEPEAQPRLMLLTDAGVNIRPNLQRKADIIKNALAAARALGIERPRVAVLAATEKVNFPAMPATLDADLLAKMAADGVFGDARVAGPLALDLAVSPPTARLKGVDNPVAGRADILVAPDIESGNILYKAVNSFLGAAMASVAVGCKAPVVLPSRGDSERSKFVSIAFAALLAGHLTGQTDADPAPMAGE